MKRNPADIPTCTVCGISAMYRRRLAKFNNLFVCGTCNTRLKWFEKYRYSILYTVENKGDKWH